MDNEALGWDSTIENEGGTVVLPEDTECTYKVLSMEKSHSEKHNCPQAILELELAAVDGSGRTLIRDYLTLNRKSEWKLCEFFISNGQRKHGERIAPNWARVPGCTGRCTVSVEPWKNNPDRVSNKIKKYLEPAEAEDVSFG